MYLTWPQSRQVIDKTGSIPAKAATELRAAVQTVGETSGLSNLPPADASPLAPPCFGRGTLSSLGPVAFATHPGKSILWNAIDTISSRADGPRPPSAGRFPSPIGALKRRGRSVSALSRVQAKVRRENEQSGKAPSPRQRNTIGHGRTPARLACRTNTPTIRSISGPRRWNKLELFSW